MANITVPVKKCAVPSCDRDAIAKGFCIPHWERNHIHGSPMEDVPLLERPRIAHCSVDGCPNSHYAKTYCRIHYNRWARQGVPHTLQELAPSACIAEGCDRPPNRRGLCELHRMRLWRLGTLELKRSGLGYIGAHRRVYRAKGKASEHACVRCAGCAQQWAYDHLDTDELSDTNGTYSAKPEHYVPMCRSCHKRFDNEHSRTHG